jgi:4-aminobutyrate aminotransferase-like enzyme
VVFDEAVSISVRRSRRDAPVFERGEGCYLIDAQGRAFLDASGGSGAVNLGHQRREIVEAVQRQAARLIHTGWNFDHPWRHELIARLARLVPYDDASVMGAVTGAEAIEVALKIARAHTGRADALYFERSFHGKTQGALAVTSNPRFRAHLAPELRGYPAVSLDGHYAPTADADEVRRELDARLSALAADDALPAAAVIEPIQAAEGIHEVPRAVLGAILEVCRDHGVVSIFDEIYTGLGRTGTPFVADATLRPDLLVIGKALGNGLPISAVVGRGELVDRLGYAAHSSTFTFMPLTCAVACTVADLHLAEEPWRRAASVGAHLAARLRALAAVDARVRSVRGRGLMLAFEVVDPSVADAAARVTLGLEDRGVVVRGGGTTIKLTPPLVLTNEQADEIVDATAATLEAL